MLDLLLRWPQMRFLTFVSLLVPFTASAKALDISFVEPGSRAKKMSSTTKHPNSCRYKIHYFKSRDKKILSFQVHKLFFRYRQKNIPKCRKVQLSFLWRKDLAPSEASTNRQGSKSTTRTGTTTHSSVFLQVWCASSRQEGNYRGL